MTDYFDRTQALGVRLMGLLAVSLGLDPALFEGCFSKSETAMRLLHYSDEVWREMHSERSRRASSKRRIKTIHPDKPSPCISIVLG